MRRHPFFSTDPDVVTELARMERLRRRAGGAALLLLAALFLGAGVFAAVHDVRTGGRPAASARIYSPIP